MSKRRKKTKDGLREHERDIIKDTRSSSGHGGIRAEGLKPPTPGKFKKYSPRPRRPGEF